MAVDTPHVSLTALSHQAEGSVTVSITGILAVYRTCPVTIKEGTDAPWWPIPGAAGGSSFRRRFYVEAATRKTTVLSHRIVSVCGERLGTHQWDLGVHLPDSGWDRHHQS